MFFHKKRSAGFTLIELSIVLIVIGLLIGGVLVGRDLIASAEIRSQISQIEKYQTAANTFKLKYGYLPGDISDPTASAFGFMARGTSQGQGDGNAILEARNGANTYGTYQSKGETAMFWVDLSTAGLIDGRFSTAQSNADQTATGGANLSPTSTPTLDAFFPTAKVGRNWIMVYSASGINYFDIAGGFGGVQPNGAPFSGAGLTVKQAYDIDVKLDDGAPQTGVVNTKAIFNNTAMDWAGVSPGVAVSHSGSTCYGNSNNASNPMVYSLNQSSGSGVNCALSFKF